MNNHPALPSIQSLLAAEIPARLGIHEDGQLYMLVDGARLQCHKKSMSFPMLAKDGISLAVDDPGHEAHAFGPLLFEFEWRVWSRIGREQTLDTLFRSGICSLIISTLSVDDLAAHFRKYLDVKLADGTEMMMRFFDPRVLPFWFESLPDAYASEVSGGLAGWAVVAHDQELRWLPMHQENVADAVPFPIQLEAKIENELLSRCFPYVLLDRLQTDANNLIQQIEAPKRYSYIATMIDKALYHGFDGIGNLENYCHLALSRGLDFDATEAFRSAMAELTKPYCVHNLIDLLVKADP